MEFRIRLLAACRAGGIVFAVITAALLCGSVADAQSQAVSSDQLLSIFNNLPPDQQQQLIQQFSAGAATGAGGINSSSFSPGVAGRQNSGLLSTQDQLSQEARRRAAQSDQTRYAPDGSPLLKASDTVLIDIELARPESDLSNASGNANARQNAPDALQSGGGIPPGVQQPSRAGGDSGSGAVNGSAQTRSETDTGERSPEMQRRLWALVTLIRSRNPYVLDRNGALQLPGFAPMFIGGLTETLATKRIAAEPSLANLNIKLTLLPLTRVGTADLKPFGYELFSGAAAGIVPSMDAPVPADYVVGAGDVFSVQLFGSQNRTLTLSVSRDGRIAFPELGPISVGGRRFGDVQQEIESRVNHQLVGTRASLSMGAVRSISVFVVGEVNAPGSYAVSGLSTITSALFASGGVRPIGSLRDIQLKRAGQTVRHLDLYDLLMRGDTSNDAHVLPGDVIFIPTIGATVAADGEVRRPGIYEIKGATSTANLIEMAGGFTVDADARRGALERVDERQRRIALDVDFTAPTASQELRNGDVLRVARLRPTLDSGVIVQGEIFRPGAFAWHQGLRLTDIIGSVNELKPDADQHYLLIRREQPPDRHIAVLSADLVAALKDPASSANVPLEPQDQITVFDLQSGRERVIKPLMDELKLQASLAAPTPTVTVSGKVKVAGDYPLEIGMKVSDLVRAGGSLDDAAYGGTAELSRYIVENGQARRTEVIPIDLAAALRGDPAADLILQPYDGLYVKEISGWSEQEQVTLAGEVRFPGTYPIKRGETLKSVIERSGGLTDLAFARGSVFTRAQLRQREQDEINRLTDRMQNELAATSLMLARTNQANPTQTYTIGQSLLGQLKASRAVGRLVINLEATIAAPAGSPDDIVLKNGDQLIVPRRNQEVTVIGEVQNVTSHLYQPKLSRDDYVQLSGGTTRLADRGRIYVVRADGSVVAGSTRWLKAGAAVAIQPGDTIVVPLDTEREPALPMWQSVTTILYNIAIAVAAIHSF